MITPILTVLWAWADGAASKVAAKQASAVVVRRMVFPPKAMDSIIVGVIYPAPGWDCNGRA
jgi:hypothetical protein